MNQEKEIVEFLQKQGPATPTQLAKQLGQSPLIASAMFADLSSRGIVLISSLKIGGGSPLYFSKEQKPLLENFTHALQKDIVAYNLLKEQKVIHDTAVTPVIRMSLRMIKDFALPLHVVVKNNGEEKDELFWKWYSISDTECNTIIRSILTGNKVTESELEQKKQSASEKIKKEELTEKDNRTINLDDKKEQKSTKKTKIKKEETTPKKVTEEVEKPIENKVKSPPALPETPTESSKEKNKNATSLETIGTTPFLKKVADYFKEKRISVETCEILKKNKELLCIITVPSAITTIRFIARIADKKKISEGDIALFALQCQQKALPGIYFIAEELPSKTKDMMKALCKDITIIAPPKSK